MKTKYTILALLIFFTANFTYAQSSAEIADIAVQGIARDDNNTAKANTTIALTFEFYYLDADNGGNRVTIGNAETESIATDAFGVFSHILSLPPNNNPRFANQQVHLVISEGGDVISDELLKHVPYAIAANNGVPTGSIMPYMGETAPTGWVFCRGQSIAAEYGTENLRRLLGSDNVPDLQGFFLRGAGTNPLTPVITALGETQDDTNLSHGHGVPNSYDKQNTAPPLNVRVADASARTSTTDANSRAMPTTNEGGQESRPVAFGVNYIIKL